MRYIRTVSIITLAAGLTGVAAAQQASSTYVTVAPDKGTVIYEGVGVQNGPVFIICVDVASPSPLTVNLLGNNMMDETLRQVEPGDCRYFQASKRVRLSWPENATVDEDAPVRVDVITN